MLFQINSQKRHKKKARFENRAFLFTFSAANLLNPLQCCSVAVKKHTIPNT